MEYERARARIFGSDIDDGNTDEDQELQKNSDSTTQMYTQLDWAGQLPVDMNPRFAFSQDAFGTPCFPSQYPVQAPSTERRPGPDLASQTPNYIQRHPDYYTLEQSFYSADLRSGVRTKKSPAEIVFRISAPGLGEYPFFSALRQLESLGAEIRHADQEAVLAVFTNVAAARDAWDRHHTSWPTVRMQLMSGQFYAT